MNPFTPLVPRLWAPDEALAAVTLLRQAIDAIWEAHGEAMAVTALQEPERWSIQDLVGRGSPDDDDEPDEDMSY
ncbi:hypothetical protein GW813_02480 [bacterium]|nr:hypothetical protein [bacterium]